MDSFDIMHHVLKLESSLEWINYTILEIIPSFAIDFEDKPSNLMLYEHYCSLMDYCPQGSIIFWLQLLKKYTLKGLYDLHLECYRLRGKFIY